MIDVDTGSFFAIVLVAAIAATTVAVVPRGLAPPVVVLELILGIVIGPEVLHLAHSSDFIKFFSNLGLGMLFYFAGYEIDFERIRGLPLRLGSRGWLLSILIAYAIGGGFEPDVRAAVERDLVADYCARLNAAGIDYAMDECWRDYCENSVWGVVMSIIATMLAEETERGNEMLTTMLRRHARHALDLDALALLRKDDR